MTFKDLKAFYIANNVICAKHKRLIEYWLNKDGSVTIGNNKIILTD